MYIYSVFVNTYNFPGNGTARYNGVSIIHHKAGLGTDIIEKIRDIKLWIVV